MGAAILALAFGLVHFQRVTEVQPEMERPLPVFPAMESRCEAGGYFPPGNAIWFKLNKSAVQPGEWREIVGKCVDPEQAKLEYRNEVLKALMKDSIRSQSLRNPPIHNTGFYDEEAAKAQQRI